MLKGKSKRKYASINPFSRKSIRRNPSIKWQRRLLYTGSEIISLSFVSISTIITILGYSASWFSGTHLFDHLLPFAIGIAGFVLVAALFLLGWWRLRTWLHCTIPRLVPVLSLFLISITGWWIMQDSFFISYGNFRTLIGGKTEANRVTIAHQVYANYRRYDSKALQTMINRSSLYQNAINEAAKTFAIDAHLLHGIAATESSFLPRDSIDGGRGLFQITKVPQIAIEKARKQLNVDKIVLHDHRHNAFVAAATLNHYMADMKNDLFLGLLAYNIGPANGGLRFIMQQYGANDFSAIQPYLQTLPRDYPIRVLTHALAFRLWQQEGKLLAYEQENNAIRIQRIGIPGLHTNFLNIAPNEPALR